jgi:hypothetical protein
MAGEGGGQFGVESSEFGVTTSVAVNSSAFGVKKGGMTTINLFKVQRSMFNVNKSVPCQWLTPMVSLLGQVIEKEYSLKTSYAELKFSRSQIVHIHFENPPQLPQDEMLLLTGDTPKGIRGTRDVHSRSSLG